MLLLTEKIVKECTVRISFCLHDRLNSGQFFKLTAWCTFSSDCGRSMKCLTFRPKIAYQMVRVWDLGVEPPLKRLWMGIPPGFGARYESLGELRFNEGHVPGTKPFKLVFVQREFPPELVRNKKLVPCTNPSNCVSPDSISRQRQHTCTYGLDHICSHDNRNCYFSLSSSSSFHHHWAIGGDEIHKHGPYS